MTTETFQICEVTAAYRRPITALEKIRDPDNIAKLTREIIGSDGREHFIVFHLDGNHAVVNYTVTSIGTANSCQVHPRDIFQAALLVGSVSIVLAHNHPSNNEQPSKEDISLTGKLVDAGKLLGIKLLDHVIVTDTDFYSLRESESPLFAS